MVVKNKSYGDKFTEEQKKTYLEKKEKEKEVLFKLYQKFLESKTISEIIELE